MIDTGNNYYAEKYAVLRTFVSNERDFDTLAAHAGYTKTRAADFRRTRARLVEAYLLELSADFDTLWRTAVASRRDPNEKLIVSLRAGDRALHKLIRQVRLRLFVERWLIPNPAAAARPSAVRRVIRALIPPVSDFGPLLREMELIRATLA